jgi:hypothetical protein
MSFHEVVFYQDDQDNNKIKAQSPQKSNKNEL